jgi:hypothetical protein
MFRSWRTDWARLMNRTTRRVSLTEIPGRTTNPPSTSGRPRRGRPSLIVRRLPIARQPRERDAAFKDDARGSPCPPYRATSTTRLVAPTTCCAGSRIGGGSSVRAPRHQRAAAWPKQSSQGADLRLTTPASPIEAEERLLVSNTPRGHSVRAAIRVLRWVRRD